MRIKNEWLQNLKAGDEAILFARDEKSIVRVEKLTPKTIVFPNGFRFNRETGRQIGADPWIAIYLTECTSEAKAAVLAEHRCRLLVYQLQRTTNFRTVPLEKLERIAAILAEPRE